MVQPRKEFEVEFLGSQGGDPAMERRSKFHPAVDALESRQVLSHGGHATSVVVSGLNPQAQVLSSKQNTVIAEVDQAFNLFTSDYDQARATYFASIEGVANPGSPTTSAFKLYTKQRVSLLAQQIISSFLQNPNGTARAKGEPPVLKTLLNTKIINTTAADPTGSLSNSLMANIPPPGISAPAASLYSLSQDVAIETARDEVINGTNIVNTGAFGVTNQN
jgi:hypothetical protein